jgi:hypothetical protein
MNASKTNFILFPGRTNIDPVILSNFNITHQGTHINKVKETKFLGMIIDENLNWKSHIVSLIKKITPIVYAIKRIRPLINLDAAPQLYYAHIYSHLIYMNPLWNVASDDSIDSLAVLQRKALRFVFQKDPRCHNAELFNEKILPLELLNDYHLLILAFKLKHNMIRNNIPIRHVRDIHNYNTRQTNYFYIRYGTKIKNCSGFMKVDQFLVAGSLLSPKILILPK